MLTKLTIRHLHTTTFLLATRAFKPPSHLTIARTPQRYMSLVTIPEAITAHADEDSVFVDGSWYMPNTRDGREEFQLGPRITGARYFDIDDVCAPSIKNLPHMKPTPEQFSLAMDLMNITPSNTLYVYGNNSHRAYWTLQSGHDPNKVKLIQGSLDEWKLHGGKLDYTELNQDDERLFRLPSDWEEQSPNYKCFEVENTVNMEEMLDIVTSKSAVVVDARSDGRFVGRDPEPRPGLRGGHMPHALNLPFVSLLDPDDATKFKPLDEVKQLFIDAGVKPYETCGEMRKVVCTCGSGVTAAALAVSLEECGLRKRDDVYIYDGSWIEWGGDDSTPIVKGE